MSYDYFVKLANYYLGTNEPLKLKQHDKHHIHVYDYNNKYLGDLIIHQTLREQTQPHIPQHSYFYSEPVDKLAYILSGKYTEDFPSLSEKIRKL